MIKKYWWVLPFISFLIFIPILASKPSPYLITPAKSSTNIPTISPTASQSTSFLPETNTVSILEAGLTPTQKQNILFMSLALMISMILGIALTPIYEKYKPKGLEDKNGD